MQEFLAFVLAALDKRRRGARRETAVLSQFVLPNETDGEYTRRDLNDRFGDFMTEFRARKEYTDNVKPTDFADGI